MLLITGFTILIVGFLSSLLLQWSYALYEEKPLLMSIISKNSNIIHDPIDVCSISDTKYDCGYFGITKEQCEARFCCWRPSENNWCFYKKGDPYSCNIDPATRVDCGYFGIQEDECVHKLNCCWNPTDVIGGNYCYYRSQPCRGYKVVNSEKHNNDRILMADLKLNGIGCGIYGHDSRHLKLLVEVTFFF
jgi:hypothetical protein